MTELLWVTGGLWASDEPPSPSPQSPIFLPRSWSPTRPRLRLLCRLPGAMKLRTDLLGKSQVHLISLLEGKLVIKTVVWGTQGSWILLLLFESYFYLSCNPQVRIKAQRVLSSCIDVFDYFARTLIPPILSKLQDNPDVSHEEFKVSANL